MLKRKFIMAAAAVMFLAFAGALTADEIVKSEDIDSMYTDHKAYKVGDIVKIIVIESTQGSQTASLKTSKKAGLGGGMGVSNWGGGVNAIYPYSPGWAAGGEEYQDGGGKSVRSGSLMGTVSARVEKVLSNGNLSVRGTKVVTINDDKQNFVVTGVIRPEDISSDNTIYSTNVADAVIEYEGNGPIGEKTSPGIITRLFDWLGLF